MAARRTRSLAVLAVMGGLLAGCTGTPAPAPAAPSAAPAASPGGGTLGDTAGRSPLDLALQMEALLGQHSVLCADMMRSRIRNDPDFAAAATAAVTRNTEDLTAVVGALFGTAAADSFRTAWSDHAAAFSSYARAVATNDAAGKAEARGTLIAFEGGLGDFFAAASQGRLPRATARAALTMHVDHLLGQADRYAAGDFAQADDGYRTAFTHAYGIGNALATTLLPPDAAATLGQPRWRLRAELDRLLGEHVAMSIATLRAGATGSPEFTAAAASLNRNTADLATAMGTLLGAPAGQQFLTLWADQVDALVAYAGSRGDTAKRQAALEKLSAVQGGLAGLLTSATGAAGPGIDLAAAFRTHDQMLTSQVDAVAGKDYRQAHDLAYDAYQDMFHLSRQLADAFGQTIADKLPRGGAETGAGGAAPGR